MRVENALVERCVIDVESVVDWLLFVEAKSCPLLKEYATKYFSGRVKDIFAHAPRIGQEVGRLTEVTERVDDCYLK